MATVERTAKSITWYDLGSQATYIANLRATMTSGGLITASDLNTLAYLINNACGHYHTWDDAIQLATYGAGYGNNPAAGDRTNYYEDKASGDTRVTNVATVPQGALITASVHNLYRQACINLKGHSHVMSDRYSI